MKKQLIIIFFLSISLLNCTMKQQQDTFNKKEYQELHKHQGTDNYEIIKIVSENNLAKYQQLDTVSKEIVLKSYYKPENKKENTYETLKVNFIGEKIVFDDTNTILKDGTMFSNWYYINWIINGDTTKHKYIDPFTNKEIDDPFEHTVKEKDTKKWLKKFVDYYNKASYVYESSWSYYMKINDIWYYFKPNYEIINTAFNKKYPNKENQDVRMVALEDLAPSFGVPPEQRDTKLIRERDYESVEYEEESWGLFKMGYSAGWWYLDIYMPLGDVVRIKHFSSFRHPDIELYKIPAAYGGRNDVLFIVQKPNPIHKEQKAGMYVIRPRDPKQPQQRYKLIKYKRDDEGYKIIDKEESIETEEYKNWIKKKKNI